VYQQIFGADGLTQTVRRTQGKPRLKNPIRRSRYIHDNTNTHFCGRLAIWTSAQHYWCPPPSRGRSWREGEVLSGRRSLCFTANNNHLTRSGQSVQVIGTSFRSSALGADTCVGFLPTLLPPAPRVAVASACYGYLPGWPGSCS